MLTKINFSQQSIAIVAVAFNYVATYKLPPLPKVKQYVFLKPLNGKQGKCHDTCTFLQIFALRKSVKTPLVGARPKPATSGQIGPKLARCAL